MNINYCFVYLINIIIIGFPIFSNAQIAINASAVPGFSTAAQGDLYLDNNGVYYIGLQDGSLKELGVVTAQGMADGDILSWNSTSQKWEAASSGTGGSGWELNGNSVNSGEFIGSTNSEDLVFRVNNSEVGRLDVNGSVAWGFGTSTNNTNVVSIGASSNVYGNNGVAIGRSSDASVNGVAVGDDANAYGTNGNATALGSSSSAQEYAVAIGHQADASSINGVTIGRESSVYGNDGVAIGENAQSSTRSVALGADAQSSSTDGVALGSGTNVYGTDGIAIGRGAQAAQNTIAVGAGVNAYTSNTIILGTNQNVGIGNAQPTARLDVAAGDLRLRDYPKTRDDSGTEPVDNILYTDANGNVLSAPASEVFGLIDVETKSTAYTLTLADHNKVIEFNSATDVVCTVPAGLPTGFQVSITQLGTGRVEFVGGATLRNAYNSFKTSRQYSKAGVEVASNGEVIISGDVAQ